MTLVKTRKVIVHRSVDDIFIVINMYVYAQLDGKLERNLDGWIKQYNKEES